MVKISIVIPVYNTEKYISACLDSILTQTYQNIEVIIVNDGSSDNSLEIINKYAVKDNRIISINLKNSGVSKARNEGIKVATGKYIMFVDSDDWIEKEACETVLIEAESSKTDTVLFNYVSEGTKLTINKYLFGKDNKYFSENEVYIKLFCGVIGLTGSNLKSPANLDNLVSVWGKLYSLEIIKNNSIEFIDLTEIPSECQLFNYEYFKYSKKVSYLANHLYHYRRFNQTSVTKNYRKDLFEKWLRWIKFVKFDLDEGNYSNTAYEAYYNRICFSLIPLTGNLLKKDDFQFTLNQIKKILNNSKYQVALRKLDFSHFKPHWWLYFTLAKHERAFSVFFLSKVMRLIIDFRKK